MKKSDRNKHKTKPSRVGHKLGTSSASEALNYKTGKK